MKKFTKFLCVALCVLLCATVLFSAESVVHGHDCIDDDCRYCQTVSLWKELMRLILPVFFSASFALLFVQMLLNVKSRGKHRTRNINLVENKVKLTA